MPTAPTPDPMQAWASAHAHEVCVLATKAEPCVEGTSAWYCANTPHGEVVYTNYGVLVPLAQYTPAMQVMPISYCNPAE